MTSHFNTVSITVNKINLLGEVLIAAVTDCTSCYSRVLMVLVAAVTDCTSCYGASKCPVLRRYKLCTWWCLLTVVVVTLKYHHLPIMFFVGRLF
jgi:hypothetical protein